MEQLRENITLTKQEEGNLWHQGKDRPEKIKKTETSSVYDCTVEDVELVYVTVIFYFFARNIKVMKMYIQMYFITNANRQYCTKERSAAILD